MQNSQTAIGMEAMHNASGSRVNQLKQEFVNHNSFNEPSLYDNQNQLDGFMPQSNNINGIHNYEVQETLQDQELFQGVQGSYDGGDLPLLEAI